MNITELAQKYDQLKGHAQKKIDGDQVVVYFNRYSQDTGEKLAEIEEVGSVKEAELEIKRLGDQIRQLKQLIRTKPTKIKVAKQRG